MTTPEILSGEDVRKILHVSRRKASWLLTNGYIRCCDSGKKTRKFTVLREDLDAYIAASIAHPERFRTPEGAFTSKRADARRQSYVSMPRILPESFRPWLEERWKRTPDLLTLDSVSTLTGYAVSTLKRWAGNGKLRTVIVPYNVVTTKTWLIDFFCADGYAVKTFSKKHRRILKKFFSEQNAQ